jgi:hypothetical protein
MMHSLLHDDVITAHLTTQHNPDSNVLRMKQWVERLDSGIFELCMYLNWCQNLWTYKTIICNVVASISQTNDVPRSCAASNASFCQSFLLQKGVTRMTRVCFIWSSVEIRPPTWGIHCAHTRNERITPSSLTSTTRSARCMHHANRPHCKTTGVRI